MFHAKDHKTGHLFEPFDFLGPKRLERIKQSWAGLFREEILAELPVEQMRGHYDQSQGRPSKEVYSVLGAVLLQQMLDLTDEETVDAFAFNLQWRYALDLRDESDQGAYLCAKTLWTMRSMVIREEVAPVLFDRVSSKLKKVFQVDTSRQRLDSMHIVSNMRRLGRVSLIAQTIRKFLVNLKRRHGDQFAGLKEELREGYMPRSGEGVFALVKPSEAGRALKRLGEDLYDLIEQFGGDPEIGAMHSYRLLVRVFSEQFRVEAEEVEPVHRIVVKANEEVASDSLQSPSDPDATYGYKGKGYQVQMMESYGEEEEGSERQPNLITYVEVEGAHERDNEALMPALEKTRQEGRGPTQVVADCAYGSDQNVMDAGDEGVELIAPVKATRPRPAVGLAEFSYDQRRRVKVCPRGHPPLKTYGKKDRHTALFDGEICEGCSLRDQCPVKRGGRGYYLRYTEKLLRLALRKAHEQSEEFRQRYRYRSGCEATMSELDRKTGINILRATRFKNVQNRAPDPSSGPPLPRNRLLLLIWNRFRQVPAFIADSFMAPQTCRP